MAPLIFPNKVLLMGFNYYDHLVKDAGITDFRKEDKAPFFFLKPPTTSVVGAGRSVIYPKQSQQLDWEIELVVVIGKRGRDIPVDQAMNYVAGYTTGLDLSARDWQFNPRHPRQFDIFCGKAFDGSAPIGPSIIPARFVDASDLTLKLWVNGALKQDSHTREMIRSIPEQIAAASEHLTFEPGDILFTGCPAGVGFATQTYLKVGDKIDAEIGSLGRLSVEIAAGA